MCAYSRDLRERIIQAWEDGKSTQELAQIYRFSWATVKRIIQRYQTTGSVDVQVRQKWHRQIEPSAYVQLEQQLQTYPDATLAQHVDYWEASQGVKVSVSTMWRAIQAVGWTHKKK